MLAGSEIQQLLNLELPPIAVSFRPEPPPGMHRTPAAAPAGCAYWLAAARGGAFYTQGEDHYNCPIGAHTHGVAMPPERQGDLGEMVAGMVGIGYLDPAEVPLIPARQEPFGVAVYAPLEQAQEAPDVVLVRGRPAQIMLLVEAAAAAGIAGDGGTPLMARPTCAAIPAVLRSGRAAASLGCIGNRVYTSLEDDEFYLALPGARVETVAEKLATIVRANEELERFHRARL